MKSVGIRGSLVAAVASIFVLNCNITSPAHAQQAALADNPELAAKGVWNGSTAYVKDDIVTARGSAWIAKKANTGRVPGSTTPNNAQYWQLFARGFNPLGAWSSAITYQPDDVVTFNGQTFRAKRTKAASQPAANAFWELFAAKGAAGPNTGIPDGTSNAPGISFAGDSNTGIYQPETGKIAIVAGGLHFLHNLGTANTGVGLNALGNNGAGALNTAVGSSALGSNTSGNDNTAVGQGALGANTSGARNTAMGSAALDANQTGNENTAVGQSALGANTGGIGNTAVGYRALLANTTGNNNLAIGTEVLPVNTTGSFNIALGSGAAGGNTTADSNIAIGINALATNQTGNNNVAIGRDALSYSTAGDNTAVGFQALYLATTGINNTAVGSAALKATTSGDNNTAIGNDALAGTTSGGVNTALGSSALAANTTGSLNIGIGPAALQNSTSGDSNIAIGFAALGSTTTTSSNIGIGNNAGFAANGSTSSIFIGNTGQVADSTTIRIGTAQTSAYMAGIFNQSVDGATDTPVIIDSAGKLGTTVSSRRYKFDIEPMADMSAMLGKLRPVTFRYKEAQNGRHPLQYGLIAEEVAELFPDLAVFNKDGGVDTVKYHLLPNFLLAGYQAQQKTIAVQADEIAELKQRLAAIEAMLPRTMKAAAR